MSEQTPTNEAGSNAADSTPVVKQLVDQVTKLTAQLNETQTAASQGAAVLSDPDVQKLLKMKEAGEEVSFAAPEAVPDPLGDLLTPDAVNEADEQFGDFSPNDVIKHIGAKLTAVVEAAVTDRLKPLEQRLDAADEQRQNETSAAETYQLQTDLETLSKKRPDLKDFQKDMVALSNKPLGVEDYYNLAKINKIGLPEDAPQSERPFDIFETGNSRPVDSNRPVRHGRTGMSAILKDALDKKFR